MSAKFLSVFFIGLLSLNVGGCSSALTERVSSLESRVGNLEQEQQAKHLSDNARFDSLNQKMIVLTEPVGNKENAKGVKVNKNKMLASNKDKTVDNNPNRSDVKKQNVPLVVDPQPSLAKLNPVPESFKKPAPVENAPINTASSTKPVMLEAKNASNNELKKTMPELAPAPAPASANVVPPVQLVENKATLADDYDPVAEALRTVQTQPQYQNSNQYNQLVPKIEDKNDISVAQPASGVNATSSSDKQQPVNQAVVITPKQVISSTETKQAVEVVTPKVEQASNTQLNSSNVKDASKKTKDANVVPPVAGGSLSNWQSSDATYNSGLNLLDANKPLLAKEKFEQFITDNPNSPLIPNAYYWLGESFFGLKKYDQAILTFKEVTNNYSKHPKAAAAMLKTAFAYQKLGDKDNARFYLETLIAQYPKSEPVALAKKRLANL